MPILVSNNKKQGQKNRRNPPVFNFGRNPFAPTRINEKYRLVRYFLLKPVKRGAKGYARVPTARMANTRIHN